MFWPEHQPVAANTNLRQALTALRRVIDDRAAQSPFINTTRATLQFNITSDYSLDVAEFLSLLGDTGIPSDQTSDLSLADVERCERAIQLYRGDFLEHLSVDGSPLFEDWALLKRELLHSLAFATALRLTNYYEHNNMLIDARRMTRQQLALEPWREESHCQMMRILDASGERMAALKQYETCYHILTSEFGIEPTQETQKLYAQMRNKTLQTQIIGQRADST
jgi:DNA-binding SARP family transcriptional activator